MLVGSPALSKGLARSEAFLRRQVTETFEVEIGVIDDPDLLAAIDFVTSYEAWEGMRRNDRHSPAAASRILRVTLLSLLTSLTLDARLRPRVAPAFITAGRSGLALVPARAVTPPP